MVLVMAVLIFVAAIPYGAWGTAFAEDSTAQTQTSEAQTAQDSSAAAGTQTAQDGSTGAQASQTAEDVPVNFVLLLDRSGSMKTSDSQNLYYSAAKMFVDMLPSENANLSVIAFGDSYGADAYQFPEGTVWTGDKNDQVKVFYPLSETTSRETKDAAKTSIDAAAASAGDTSQIGYALLAAMNTLQQGGAQKGKAAIILLSDGKVAGENEEGTALDKYEAYQFPSINDACTTAKANDWKVYCMELDAATHNNDSDWKNKSARSIMRAGADASIQSIPQQTGTDPIALNTEADAQKAFANIFSSLYGTSDDMLTVDPVKIQGGSAEMPFEIDDMVAETTLTVTGDVASLTDIQLLLPDGTTETYTLPDPESTETREVTVEPGDSGGYVSMKLLLPPSGSWKIVCHGTDGVEVGLYAVSVRDMGIQLSDNSPQQVEGVYPKGTSVELTGQYVYHNNVYKSAAVYQKYSANVTVTGPAGTKTEAAAGNEDGYHYSTVLDQYGDYTITVNVHDDKRNKDVASNTLSYHVENIPVLTAGSPQPESLAVGESRTGISIADLFQNVDGDPVTYGIEPEDGGSGDAVTAQIEPSTGMVSLQAGKLAGDMKFFVTATDGIQAAPTQQELTVTVVNQPLVFTREASSDPDAEEAALHSVNLTLKKQKIPEFLLKIGNVTGEPSYELRYSDYLTDPDDPEGSEFQVEVTQDEDSKNADAITISEQDASHLVFQASERGSAKYTLKAADANDPSVVKTLTIKVSAVNAWALIWAKIGTAVIIVVVLIIVLIIVLQSIFGGKQIYGVYDIRTSAGEVKTAKNFQKTKTGQQGRAPLKKLLEGQGIHADVGNVTLVAGIKATQKVYLTNLQGLEKLKVNTKEYSSKDLKSLKKVEIRKGATVTLTKGGQSVTLIRSRK